MAYQRTAFQRQGDFNAAREFEETVGEWLGPHKVAYLSSPDKLDYWVPGYFIEVKEKRQKLSTRFVKDRESEPDMFVLDELSVRSANVTSPTAAYFLLRDCVHPDGARMFLSSDRPLWHSVVIVG